VNDTQFDSDGLRAYYAGGGGHDEWARLTTQPGAVEWAVNTDAIAACLPPGARVLDIGGGPGRYAIWLAARGHHVTLADLSPDLLDIARDRIAQAGVGALVEDIIEADARDLTRWPDNSFDAALSLGPFYHLPDPADRERAAAKLARVLHPGGLAFVALMPRYALLRRTLSYSDERRHLAQPAFVRQLLDDGAFENDIPGRFTNVYGVRVEDVAPFFARHGFAHVALLGSQGILAGLEETLTTLARDDPEGYRAALDLAIQTANDPSILGLCNHLLYIGRKPPYGA